MDWESDKQDKHNPWHVTARPSDLGWGWLARDPARDAASRR